MLWVNSIGLQEKSEILSGPLTTKRSYWLLYNQQKQPSERIS